MSGEVGIGVYNGKKIITTKDGKKYEKAGLGTSTGAVFAANMAGGAVITSTKALSVLPLKLLLKNQKIDADVFKKSIDDAFKSSGLAEKGVKLINASEENKEVVKKVIDESLPKFIKKFAPLRLLFAKNLEKLEASCFKGSNAFFSSKTNSIIINKDKIAWAGFHEMGHAMNRNLGGVGKFLTKIKTPFAILTSVALFTSLFKRKKAEGEEPKGIFDKTTTFIKENAGKLAFLGMVPTCLEEGLASIKGAKLAEKFISPDNIRFLNKMNAAAWLTYAGSALGVGLGAYVIGKVRDEIAQPKEITEKQI